MTDVTQWHIVSVCVLQIYAIQCHLTTVRHRVFENAVGQIEHVCDISSRLWSMRWLLVCAKCNKHILLFYRCKLKKNVVVYRYFMFFSTLCPSDWGNGSANPIGSIYLRAMSKKVYSEIDKFKWLIHHKIDCQPFKCRWFILNTSNDLFKRVA